MFDIQKLIRTQRNATFAKTEQWTLGDLIRELERIDATDDCWVSFAFGDFVPTTCHSWRGSYAEIAIGYTELDWDKRPMLKDFLKHLKCCVGQVFDGYKGGEFRMNEDTPIWVAEYSKSGNTGVIGLCQETSSEGKAYRVYIRTDYCEF